MAVHKDEKFGLTPKQRAFVEAYMDGGNASQAYRETYNVTKMTDGSIYSAVNQLLNNSKITSYLDHLKAKAASKVTLTLETGVARLMAIADAAEAAGNQSAAVAATTNAMKALGIFVEKTHNMNEDMNDAHLQAMRQLVEQADNVEKMPIKEEIEHKKTRTND